MFVTYALAPVAPLKALAIQMFGNTFEYFSKISAKKEIHHEFSWCTGMYCKIDLNFFWYYENIYQLGVENWINNAISWAPPYHQDQNLPTNKPGQQEKLTHTYTWLNIHVMIYGNSQIPENPILIKTGNSACLSISSHMIHVMVG